MTERYHILNPVTNSQPPQEIEEVINRHKLFFSREDILQLYLPAMKLVNNRRNHLIKQRQEEQHLFKSGLQKVPYVISLVGSVASGKSTLTNLLTDILRALGDHPIVYTVSTDCFIFPTKLLTERNLMNQKGFPISYDWQNLIGFLKALHSGQEEFKLPIYSHEKYDIIADKFNIISKPDIVFLEGLNLLQDSNSEVEDKTIASDYIDFSIYLDVSEENLLNFYLTRILSLSHEGNGFYSTLHQLSDEEITKKAVQTWNDINYPNFKQFIEPTKHRAQMIIRVDGKHRLEAIKIKK